MKNTLKKKNLRMQDPRYKHEYLNRVQNWVTVTGEDDDDESDKHLEARDRRYSCLIGVMALISFF